MGPIGRFSDYKKHVSWAGLAPSVHQSGNVEFHGRITKRGSPLLRWALVEDARIAVRYDERMRAFYERVAKRHGDQKTIVVACKMLKIVWFMLTRRQVYGDANVRCYGEKLKRIGLQKG